MLACSERDPLPLREQGQYLGLCLIDAYPVASAEIIHFSVLDEAVWPADAHHWNRTAHLGIAHFIQRFNHGGAEAAHPYMIFKRDKSGYALCVMIEHLAVERLDEARIDDRNRKPLAFQPHGKLTSHGNHWTEAKNSHVGTVLQHLGFAYRNSLRLVLAGNTGHHAPRIANRAGARELDGG